MVDHPLTLVGKAALAVGVQAPVGVPVLIAARVVGDVDLLSLMSR